MNLDWLRIPATLSCIQKLTLVCCHFELIILETAELTWEKA